MLFSEPSKWLACAGVPEGLLHIEEGILLNYNGYLHRAVDRITLGLIKGFG